MLRQMQGHINRVENMEIQQIHDHFIKPDLKTWNSSRLEAWKYIHDHVNNADNYDHVKNG